MAIISAERGDLLDKSHIMIARYNPETGVPDMNTATPWFVSSASLTQSESEHKHKGENCCSEYKMSFSLAPIGRKDRVRHLYEFTKVGQMATRTQIARLMEGWPKRKLRWECSYDVFRQLQREAHVVFGCNLKRALRFFGCNVKVKHTTKNGYWVWMK